QAAALETRRREPRDRQAPTPSAATPEIPFAASNSNAAPRSPTVSALASVRARLQWSRAPPWDDAQNRPPPKSLRIRLSHPFDASRCETSPAPYPGTPHRFL